MKFKFISCLLLCLTYGIGNAQIGRLALSPLQTLKQKIAKTEIEIIYSRPAIRDREIFGGLVPYDKLWRTGANRNTKISFSEAVMVGDSTLKKGMYAIFTKPGRTNWEVYFYTDTDNWEVPKDWDTKKIAAKITVPAQKSSRKLESLTVAIDDMTNDQFDLSIAWDQTFVTIPVKLTTEKQMAKTITDVLSGPDADDYYLAAQYRLESGRDIEDALNWINKAIEMREKSAWWDHKIKALALLALNRKAEAKPIAEKGLRLANEHWSNFSKVEMKRIVDLCN